MPTENPGPTPDDVPDLEPGGGIAPGDTPPDAGQTSGLSHPQPMPSRTIPIVAITSVVLLVIAMAAFFLARVLDLL